MRRLTALASGVLLAGAVTAAASGSDARSTGGQAGTLATGTLPLNAVFSLLSRRGVACPPGTASTVECNTREGTGTVSGLGKVGESYTYFADTDAAGCDPADVRILGTAVRFVVAGKGDIELTTAQASCTSPLAGLTPATQAFTITGGTGVYAGASGSGTVSRALAQTDSGAAGSETWAGTLVVPGLEFDVTRPTLSGAVAKTVRARKGAKSMRVTYKVTAKDNVDGAVPASCQPRSGSRFKLGRTRVRCSATDSSGNVAEAAFTITVRPRR